MISLTINGGSHEVDVPGEMPLLWVIRDVIGLTGTKFGCGVGLCGCCTVHVDAGAVRPCSFPVSAATGKNITTIEALGGEAMHPLQQAWIDHQVPQCGYCQSGQLMAAAALLAGTPHPSDAQIAGHDEHLPVRDLQPDITIKNGRVQQSNFDNYQVLHMTGTPQIETFAVPSREAPSGIGEAGVPPVGPAIGNAIFALTGKRVRALPFVKETLA